MVPPRISVAILVTDHLAEERAFYERLGWRSAAEPDATFVLFPLAGASLALTTPEAAREQAGRDHRLGLLTGIGRPERVDQALETAAGAGAEIAQPARDRPFGRAGWFADPVTGTLWEMAHFAGGAQLAAPVDGAFIPRLNTVTVRSTEVMKARRFYEQLGFTSPLEDRDDIVQFQTQGAIFSAWVAHEMKELVGDPLHEAGFEHDGFEFGIVVESKDEVDAAVETARNAGATVFVEPKDMWWGGYSSNFCDPGGNVWEIVWVPSATLNEKKEMVLGGAPAPE
jgi:predicted lactoylglutathione lyase